MQRSLVHFLNHGLLPFVGRSAETERILGFWRETPEAQGLRVLLLTGEGGVGKSRLVEEVGGKIAASGGALVQTKLFPDSATSIAPLVAQGLSHSVTVGQLLKSEPAPTLPSVVAALTRICGLRPTLLVIEDLQLLGPESLADFSALLDRLADEPLSILCTARPALLPARPLLERFMVDEIELGGFDLSDVADLCREVLGQTIEPTVVEALYDRTTGNPLALRSALRGAMKSGAIVVGRPGIGTPPVINHNAFVETLARNVKLLSEGMVTHLTRDERAAAERLASLGELFVEEGGLVALDGDKRLLHTLIFKGIIRTSPSSPAPITGGVRHDFPLAFAHNLLHRYFLELGHGDVAMLLRLVASDIPLYSIIPFQLLGDLLNQENTSLDDVEVVIERTVAAATRLGTTTDWELGFRLFDAARNLFDRFGAAFSAEKRFFLEAEILHNRLQLSERVAAEEVPDLVDRFLLLTSTSLPEEFAHYRFLALIYAIIPAARSNVVRCFAIIDQIDSFLVGHPNLHHHSVYVEYLRHLVLGGRASKEGRIVQSAEGRFRTFLNDPEVEPALRDQALRLVGPRTLISHETEEELAVSIRMMEQLDQIVDPSDVIYRWYKAEFLLDNGEFARARALLDASIPLFNDHGLKRTALIATIQRFMARVAQGGDIPTIVQEMSRYYNETDETWRPPFRSFLCAILPQIAILRGEPDVAIALFKEYSVEGTVVSNLVKIGMATIQGTIAEWAKAELGIEAGLYRRVILEMVLRGERGEEDPERFVEYVRAWLSRPILRVEGLWRLDILAELFVGLDREEPSLKTFDLFGEDLGRGLDAALRWLAERKLPWLMAPLLERRKGYLKKDRQTFWAKEIAAMIKEDDRGGGRSQLKVRVSLLGTIAVQHLDEEPRRIRGAQLGSVLGLMVADQLLDQPLSAREFIAIATEHGRDPDSARKAINFAVFRLREILGNDAIVTGGETPELNLDLVEIDFITTARHLRNASDALRNGGLIRATPEIIAALDISAGKVPYPTLYEEFFESAREDFENQLRTTAIGIGRALLALEDNAHAEQVLARAFETMPEDEEIAELLQATLIALDKRTDAIRVGLRV